MTWYLVMTPHTRPACMPGLLAGTQVTKGEELIKKDRTSGQVRRLILLLSGDVEENPGPDQSQGFEEQHVPLFARVKQAAIVTIELAAKYMSSQP